MSGNYSAPFGIQLGAFIQSKVGLQGQRTNIFRTADPDGGPSISNNGNTTIRLEQYGSQSLSAYNILNFRANKDFRMTGGRRLSIDFDIFNLLNSATPTGATNADGCGEWRTLSLAGRSLCSCSMAG